MSNPLVNDRPLIVSAEEEAKSPHDASATWKNGLKRDDRNKPRGTLSNAIHAFRISGEWRDCLAYNTLTDCVECMKPPPFQRSAGPWNDTDDARAAEWLQRHDINVNPSTVSQAVDVVSKENSFNPLQDYLNGLAWDGCERLCRMASLYLGVPDRPVYAAYSQCFMISAAARAFDPGCKADCMLVFEGSQGTGKSQAIKILGGDYYGELSNDFASKAAVEQIQGKWIVEEGELSAMGRSQVEAAKAFMSRAEDRMRPAYGRRVKEYKRSCVFIGTTNTHDWHTDATGGRRFWPIRVGAKIDLDALRRDRDQLWAEAVVRYRNGEAWHIFDQELIAVQQSEIDERVPEDPWSAPVMARARELGGRITMKDALTAVGLTLDRNRTAETKRVAAILKQHKYEKLRVKSDDGREYVWVAPCPS